MIKVKIIRKLITILSMYIPYMMDKHSINKLSQLTLRLRKCWFAFSETHFFPWFRKNVKILDKQKIEKSENYWRI